MLPCSERADMGMPGLFGATADRAQAVRNRGPQLDVDRCGQLRDMPVEAESSVLKIRPGVNRFIAARLHATDDGLALQGWPPVTKPMHSVGTEMIVRSPSSSSSFTFTGPTRCAITHLGHFMRTGLFFCAAF